MSSSHSFWNEDIWLPPNVTWDSFSGDEKFAQFSHLYYPIPAAFLVIAVRMVIERNIFRPLGLFLGLKHHVTRHHTQMQGEEVENVSQKHISKKSDTKESWIRRKRKKISTLGESFIVMTFILK